MVAQQRDFCKHPSKSLQLHTNEPHPRSPLLHTSVSILGCCTSAQVDLIHLQFSVFNHILLTKPAAGKCHTDLCCYTLSSRTPTTVDKHQWRASLPTCFLHLKVNMMASYPSLRRPFTLAPTKTKPTARDLAPQTETISLHQSRLPREVQARTRTRQELAIYQLLSRT